MVVEGLVAVGGRASDDEVAAIGDDEGAEESREEKLDRQADVEDVPKRGPGKDLPEEDKDGNPEEVGDGHQDDEQHGLLATELHYMWLDKAEPSIFR